MNIKELITASLKTSQHVMNTYFEDMTDEEFMMRPAENANHIAWQIGHIILGEHTFMSAVEPSKVPALPEGFAEKHSKERCGEDDPTKFCSKDEYVSLMNSLREATLSILADIDEARFDDESPEMIRSFAPKVGNLFSLCADHYYMHSGQIAVLRRKLGKPIVI